MALGSNLAGIARVSYEAVGLAEFANDNQRAEASYRSSTKGMSDEAIRLELAQDKLRRSLQKGPAAYREQARAELQVRNAERALRGETDALTRSQDRNRRGLGSLRASAFGYAAAFLGGAGLVTGMKSAISIASNLEEQQNKTRVLFAESGAEVIAWSRQTAASMGIAGDQALQYAGTIGAILNTSGLAREESARLSKDVVQLAADMASFNNEDPSDMLDRLRSGLVGEAEPLRRFGVLLDEASVKAEGYRLGLAKTGEELSQGAKVQARYSLILKATADQQGDYARTADGLANSQRTLSALWREAQGIVGQALAPAFTDVVQGLRDWLAEDRNRVELQRNVNTVVGDGVKVMRALAGAIEFTADAVSPLVKAMGGLDRAIEVALIVGLATKVRRAAFSFGFIAASSRATTARVVADAAIAGRALDVAYRPRAVMAAGGGAGGLGRGALGLLGLTPGGAILTGAALVAYFGLRSNQTPALSGPEFTQIKQAAARGEFGWAELRALPDWALTDAQERELRGLIARTNARGAAGASPDNRGPRGPGAIAAEQAADASRGASSAGGRTGRTMADILLDQARAASRPGTADDLRFGRERVSFVQRQIDALERRGADTKKEKEKLAQLYGELASAQSAIDAIIDDNEAKIEAQKEKAAAKRKAARERERRREERETAEEAERARNVWKRTGRWGMGRTTAEVQREVNKLKGKGDDPLALTEADWRRMSFEFLSSLHGVVNQYGSNFQSSSGDVGQIATHAYTQTELLREQNRVLARLGSSVAHPGARYARTELTAAAVGVGF